MRATSVVTMASERASVTKANTPAQGYSLKGAAALLAGLLAVLLPAPFGMLLGGIAMLLAGAARRELQRGTAAPGAVPALLGFLLGLGVLVVQVGPLVLAYLYLLLGALGP